MSNTKRCKGKPLDKSEYLKRVSVMSSGSALEYAQACAAVADARGRFDSEDLEDYLGVPCGSLDEDGDPWTGTLVMPVTPTRRIRVTAEELADRMGIPVEEVRRGQQELIKAGYLTPDPDLPDVYTADVGMLLSDEGIAEFWERGDNLIGELAAELTEQDMNRGDQR